MADVAGSLGTCGSLALRLGQSVFSSLSLFFMCFAMDFYGYTAFCSLVTVMALVIPWSMTLALIDTYCLFTKLPSRQARIMTLVIMGDCVLSLLSLSAAVSTVSVAKVLMALDDDGYTSYCPLCAGYLLSASMALLYWFLSVASFLVNTWVLPKL